MKHALLVILLCLPSLVLAQANNGSELRNSGTDYLRICTPTAENQAKNYMAACNIWLTGVVDGLQAYNSNAKTLPLFDASNLTTGQAHQAVIKFITDHPDKAQLPTAALVLGALVENYPRKEAPAPK
jgi:Rap1a immunity proteins